MARLARAISVVLLSTVWLAAEPVGYTIQPGGDSKFELRVHKTGLMSGKTHIFRFERFRGQLEYDAENPAASKVRLEIDADSIVCLDDWVNEKERRKILEEARGPMLAVDEHPKIVFTSNGIQKSGESYQVRGALTIRGKAQPVNVTVQLMERSDGLQFSGQAQVKLEDYGLDPPSAAFGLIGTKNEMDVSFTLNAKPLDK